MGIVLKCLLTSLLKTNFFIIDQIVTANCLHSVIYLKERFVCLLYVQLPMLQSYCNHKCHELLFRLGWQVHYFVYFTKYFVIHILLALTQLWATQCFKNIFKSYLCISMLPETLYCIMPISWDTSKLDRGSIAYLTKFCTSNCIDACVMTWSGWGRGPV